MRQIDADKLMDFYLMRPTEEFLYERQYTAEDVALKIKEAPTIDPVKHGHWIEMDEGVIDYNTGEIYKMYQCSNCGDSFEMLEGEQTNYCSGCGTKMDEELSE